MDLTTYQLQRTSQHKNLGLPQGIPEQLHGQPVTFVVVEGWLETPVKLIVNMPISEWQSQMLSYPTVE